MSDEAKQQPVGTVFFRSNRDKQRKGGVQAFLRAEASEATNQKDPFDYGFGETTALQPRYDMQGVATVADTSGPVAVCNEAFSSNVVGQGYMVECMDPNGLTPEQIESTSQEIVEWFGSLPDDGTFLSMRKRAYKDFLNGNAFIEVVRNKGGEIATLSLIPFYTMRVCGRAEKVSDARRYAVQGREWVQVMKPIRRRLFVQIVSGIKVFFKEFGDERLIDAATGTEVAETANPAHEVLWFRNYSPMDEYGVPRWASMITDAMGHRKAGEVNYAMFEANMIPRLAIICEGGQWTNPQMEAICDAIEEHAGTAAFHAPLLLTMPPVETMGPSGTTETTTPKIRLEQLSKAFSDDGMFLGYQDSAETNVRSAYLLPEVLVGRSKDLTYGSVRASLETAETQVFAAARAEDDAVWNQLVADTSRKRSAWRRFRIASKRAAIADVESVAAMIREAKDSLTINDVRKVSGEALSQQFPAREEAWASVPNGVLAKLTGAGSLAVQPDESIRLTEAIMQKLTGVGIDATQAREIAAVVVEARRMLAELNP